MMPRLYFSEVDNGLLSEDFARLALGQYLRIDGKSLKINRSEFGKPYLEEHPPVHFNISHASGAIICAVSDRPVGVDLEKTRKANYGIINRFFSEEEKSYVFSGKDNQDQRFTRIWTMKESYVKCIGKGLLDLSSSNNVLLFKGIITFIYKEYHIAICQDPSSADS